MPAFAQGTMSNSTVPAKQTEMTHAKRADQERMAAGKQAKAAKDAHWAGKHKMAARHHRMAAADDRAASVAQDKAAMSATAPK